jgi:hydroxyacylglutathione hydrolase
MKILTFTFNPFSQNTSLVVFSDRSAMIVDPGMMGPDEEKELADYIANNQLEPKWMVNTHGHIDHILGNRFCADRYGLEFMSHREDLPTLRSGPLVAEMYGLPYDPSPEPTRWLADGEILKTADREWEVRFAPGHAPGHIVLVCHEEKTIIGGDVLFRGSVGRVDLPGGDGPTLAESIRAKLYTLPDDYTVYPGHGEPTTIVWEKKNNYFVNESGSRL